MSVALLALTRRLLRAPDPKEIGVWENITWGRLRPEDAAYRPAFRLDKSSAPVSYEEWLDGLRARGVRRVLLVPAGFFPALPAVSAAAIASLRRDASRHDVWLHEASSVPHELALAAELRDGLCGWIECGRFVTETETSEHAIISDWRPVGRAAGAFPSPPSVAVARAELEAAYAAAARALTPDEDGSFASELREAADGFRPDGGRGGRGQLYIRYFTPEEGNLLGAAGMVGGCLRSSGKSGPPWDRLRAAADAAFFAAVNASA